MTAKKKAKPKKRKKNDTLNPRQKKLALLLIRVEAGELSLYEAMLKAGYSQCSAEQQKNTLDRIRKNTAMQAALREKGFNENVIATTIMEGLKATKGFTVKMGNDTVFEQSEDYMARHKYLETGAKLLDAFPSQKIDANLNINDELDEAEKDGEYAPWDDSPSAK